LGVDLRFIEEHFPPSWNIPPGSEHPAFVLGRSGELKPHPMHWGYRPHWAGEKGREVINARGESAAEKPYFRSAYQRGQRCLIPATAWYEWQKTATGKQPWALSNEAQTLFLAAVYTRGQEGLGFAIVTRPAIKSLGHIHDRMPLVLSDATAQQQWLAHEPLPGDWSQRWITGPSLPDAWQSWPVSRAVNSPENDTPQLLEQVESKS
uniref:SOS response-associated peptidase n=1 Tax=Natronospira sp. TaxID=2024970 RepID=UPI0038737B09